MNKEERSFIVNSTASALIPFFFPGFGSLIMSIYNDARSDRKQKRMIEMVESLKTELSGFSDKINKDFISQEGFEDILETTLNRASNERSEIKRLAYKNILLNGMLAETSNYDSVEYQIKILDQLNEPHIYLLKFLKDPKGYVSEMALNIPATNSATTFIKHVFPQWSIEYIRDYLSDLDVHRLVKPVAGGLMTITMEPGILRFENIITLRGKAFLSYIFR